MILAGDVGGTKTNLAFYKVDGQRLVPAAEATYPSGDYESLDQLALEFLAQHHCQADVACFGVAGPVHNGRCQATNLPWVVQADRLSSELNATTLLINDLEATAYALAILDPNELAALQEGVAGAEGNAAVIAAGTGLGEAGLYWDGSTHRPFACEGGHSDFSPRNKLEAGLLEYLLDTFGHASWERVLSGPGLHNIYRFLYRDHTGMASQAVAWEIQQGDPAAVISQAARERRCPLCERAVKMFIELYGAESGNLALKLMATGGVYLGGGIAPKMLEELRDPSFVKAFAAKGRMKPILKDIPVRVILSSKAALLGAGRCGLLGSSR